MKIAPLADVKARLSAYLVECETDGPVLITRNGKVAAILLAPTVQEIKGNRSKRSNRSIRSTRFGMTRLGVRVRGQV